MCRTLTYDISGRMGSTQLIGWYLEWSSQCWILKWTQYQVQISFVASVMMSGRTLQCVGNDQTGTVTFHVDPVVGEWPEYL